MQLSNLGITRNVSGAPDLPSVVFPLLFDVDPGAALRLRNVSINLDCATLLELQTAVCAAMPDVNFEVNGVIA